MKWTSVLFFALIGLVAAEADNFLKQDKEYNYNVVAKTVSASRGGKWNGGIFKARLAIRSESENVLIGQFSQTQYAKVESSRRYDVDVDNSKLEYSQLPLDRPFKIRMQNGVITELFVDEDMTEVQIKQLQFVMNSIMNQFLVDKDAKYEMKGDNTIYTKMEQTTGGNCETVYEISPLPGYLAQSSRDLVPLPELQKLGEFIIVTKSRNYNACDKRMGQQNTGILAKPMTEVTRTILSGTLNDFTVQSSVSTVQTADNLNSAPKTITFVNVTLESIASNNESSQITTEQLRLKNVENLIDNSSPNVLRNGDRRMGSRGFGRDEDLMNWENSYDYRSPNVLRNRGRGMGSRGFGRDEDLMNSENSYDYRVRNGARPVTSYSSYESGQVGGYGDDVETKYSGCYTWFVGPEEMCTTSLGGEWTSAKMENCGFLNLGHRALCRRQYPGCEITSCGSVFDGDLCTVFGGRLPVHNGGAANCSPGFFQWRCCPAK